MTASADHHAPLRINIATCDAEHPGFIAGDDEALTSNRTEHNIHATAVPWTLPRNDWSNADAIAIALARALDDAQARGWQHPAVKTAVDARTKGLLLTPANEHDRLPETLRRRPISSPIV